MLSDCFRCERVRLRIQANPLGPELTQLADYLRGQGYHPVVVHQYVCAAEHFGRWVGKAGLSRAIDEGMVQRFLDRHLPRCRCAIPAPRGRGLVVTALRHLLRVVGAPNSKGSGKTVTAKRTEALVRDFEAYMQSACGLSEATCRYRQRYAREFLASQFGRGPLRLNRLVPADPMTFVADYAQRCSPATGQVVGSSLRCFLRFLQLQGLCARDLAAAVPRIADWEQSTLPRALTEQELQRFLASFDRTTSTGRRDYAMALCMVELGLRASEVGQLHLEDLDWRQSTLCIVGGKSRRVNMLPLSRGIGKAIAAYLHNGRPKSLRREIFLRHRAPFALPVSKELVRGVMRRGYRRCGLDPSWTGTHLLRHTAATRMHQHGASLKEIADILGHRSIDTSATYTRIDLPTLSTIALPWPEVQP